MGNCLLGKLTHVQDSIKCCKFCKWLAAYTNSNLRVAAFSYQKQRMRDQEDPGNMPRRDCPSRRIR